MVDQNDKQNFNNMIGVLQRNEIIKQGQRAKDVCGGLITDLSFSKACIEKFGLKGKKAIILGCKFCDTDSVIADKKCLWCGEDNSWEISDRELSCPACNQHFTAATCKHCKKESPAMRLYLLYSPELIAEFETQKEQTTRGCLILSCIAIGVLFGVPLVFVVLFLIFGKSQVI